MNTVIEDAIKDYAMLYSGVGPMREQILDFAEELAQHIQQYAEDRQPLNDEDCPRGWKSQK